MIGKRFRRAAVVAAAVLTAAVATAAPASATWYDRYGPDRPAGSEGRSHVICVSGRGINGVWTEWRCGDYGPSGYHPGADPAVTPWYYQLQALRVKQWGLTQLCIDALVGGIGWRGAVCGGEGQVFEVGSPDYHHALNGFSVANYDPTDTLTHVAYVDNGTSGGAFAGSWTIPPNSWHLFDLHTSIYRYGLV